MKTKPTFSRSRPLSWSALSSFEWDPEQWYRKYVLGEPTPLSEELKFGSYIDKKLQDDPSFLPMIPRYPIAQHEMKVKLGSIPLIGFADAFHPMDLKIRDFKTGKKAWDQKRADETGQLTMYLLMLFIMNGIKPEKMRCFIDWIPTKENGDFTISLIEPCRPLSFETKRTTKQVLAFGVYIKETYQKMIEYCEDYMQ